MDISRPLPFSALALAGAGLAGIPAALYTLSNGAVDAATAARIWVTSNGLGLGIFALSFFVFLTLGLVLMAVALFRAGLAPRWAAVLLGVGVVAQGFPTSGLAAKFLPLPLAVALLVLGVVALRRGGESELNPQPEPPGVAAVAPQTARTAS
jgi:hypothetical protein